MSEEKELIRVSKVGASIRNRGVRAFPKADGRIEVPQFVIHALGWENVEKIYINESDVGMYLTSVENNTCWSAQVSGGRIRIPAGVLRRTTFFRKDLIFIIERERVFFHPSADFSEVKQSLENIFTMVNKKSGKKVGELKEALDELDSTFSSDIIPKPELILLDMNETTVFRPVNLPFKFYAGFSNTKREIVFENTGWSESSFYLVPGIKRVGASNYNIGFLLLGSMTYERLCCKIKEGGMDREVMFWPQRTAMGGFQVFLNPPNTECLDEIINIAQAICGDPKNLLETHFRNNGEVIINDVYTTPPSIITKQTINLMCQEEN